MAGSRHPHPHVAEWDDAVKSLREKMRALKHAGHTPEEAMRKVELSGAEWCVLACWIRHGMGSRCRECRALTRLYGIPAPADD